MDPGVKRSRIPSDPRVSSDPWIQPPHPPFSPLQPSRDLRGDFDRYLRFDDVEADEGPFDDAADGMLPHLRPAAGPLPPYAGPPPPRSRPPPSHPRSDLAPAPRARSPSRERPPPDFSNWRINIQGTSAPDIPIRPKKTGPAKQQPRPTIKPKPLKPEAPAPTKPQAPLVTTPLIQARPKPQNKRPVRRRNNRARRPVAVRPGSKIQTPKKVVNERPESSQQDSAKDQTGEGASSQAKGTNSTSFFASQGY